ncbi:hypothetical protein LZG75_06955 [Polynucleobacter sp. IMCC30063]|uniref:hypothetical protein n=1 Tax=Polynucleobacter sp. IMCC30063 TaxID=2907298 RepID=UPI001F320299|nr:hypothetical protein [Polynucleobacter sp. IMCC30063]MCE7505977.1 hypothetical protein [Polynucleobacter sp. IMCC30063]
MLQSLVASVKGVGLNYDFLTFSDEPIARAISCPLDSEINLDFHQKWKFHYLYKLRELDYDNFIFIDSDHYFVRKPTIALPDLLAGDSWHTFLESPINSPSTKRPDWWSMPNSMMVDLWRSFGVKQKILYNTNGGFFICKKNMIEQILATSILFDEHQNAYGLSLPEEVTDAVLTHLFSLDYCKHLHSRHIDHWASEWTNALGGNLPDGSNWEFEEYMTRERSIVNPAIVHAMRSKVALIDKGRAILGQKIDSVSFTPWPEAKASLNKSY